jgi:DNA-directed RNA polymerase specialized sigma24 family protein
MNFDDNLYIQIRAAVAKVAERKGFDTQIIEDITQEVAYRVVKAFKKPGRKEEIRDVMAYIYSIIINTFVDYYRDKKRKEFNPNDVDWLVNQELWDIIKQEKYSTQEIMQLMDMPNPASIHTAKVRLIERISDIYKKIAKSDPD